jgi:hypothetical protein
VKCSTTTAIILAFIQIRILIETHIKGTMKRADSVDVPTQFEQAPDCCRKRERDGRSKY